MVAAVFMHLSHEKKWIYGSLILTVGFFIVLMFVPLFTTMDTIGTPIACAGAVPRRAAHAGTDMSLRVVSPAVHRAVGRPRRVRRGLGGRAVSGRAATSATWSPAAVSLAAGARAGRLRRGVPAQDEEAVAACATPAPARSCCSAAPRAALACPVCFGQSDSPLAQAINMGIIAHARASSARVLAGFAAFIIYLDPARAARWPMPDAVRARVRPTGGDRSMLELARAAGPGVDARRRARSHDRCSCTG